MLKSGYCLDNNFTDVTYLINHPSAVYYEFSLSPSGYAYGRVGTVNIVERNLPVESKFK